MLSPSDKSQVCSVVSLTHGVVYVRVPRYHSDQLSEFRERCNFRENEQLCPNVPSLLDETVRRVQGCLNILQVQGVEVLILGGTLGRMF